MDTADAVVIGGGINGTNIAFHLTRLGLRKVVLLEKTAIAAAASGKTGGLIGSHFGTEIKVRLGIKALATWLHFGDVYGTKEQRYDRCGRAWLVPEQDVEGVSRPALLEVGPVDAGFLLAGRGLAPVAALVLVPRPAELAVGRPQLPQRDVVRHR